MITFFSRFRWSRLPISLCVSSEIFQQKLHEALKGLNGIFTNVDDIIVACCGETEEKAKQDNMKKLEELCKRCDEQNIMINDKKEEIGK